MVELRCIPVPEPTPNPPPVDTVRVAILQTNGVAPVVNILWVKIDRVSPPTRSDLAALLQAIGESWHTRFHPHMITSMALREIKGVWHTGVGTALEVAVGFATTGGRSNSPAPASASVLLDWQIDSRYRGGHPRSYMSGFADSDLFNSQLWSNSLVVDMVNAAKDFLADVDVFGTGSIGAATLGTVRFFSDHAALAPPEFWPYESVIAPTRICTQRRRLGSIVI
jgi:hypothetical protein